MEPAAEVQEEQAADVQGDMLGEAGPIPIARLEVFIPFSFHLLFRLRRELQPTPLISKS